MRACLLIVSLLGLGLGGCVEADLGDTPVFCNPGNPRCPKGYLCALQKGEEVCVKEGRQPASLQADAGRPGADGR